MIAPPGSIDINPLRDRWREKAIKTHIEILTFS
nr:MAG TPA: hypothetical protein [Caudoviricetes sp.]